jgi:hypothetical protein
MKIRPILAFALALGAAASLSPAWPEDGLDPVESWQADRTQIIEGPTVSLDDFKWIARPVVVFADTPADPRFQQQLALIEERIDVLALRDVVVIVDSDPGARSDVRMRLRPRGFMLAMIAKDGTVFQRKPAPWDVREISRAIDKLPQRQEEIRSGVGTGTGG